MVDIDNNDRNMSAMDRSTEPAQGEEHKKDRKLDNR